MADYEAVATPVFAWRDAVARDARTGAALNGMATVGAWRALGGAGPDGRSSAGAVARTVRRARAGGTRVRCAGCARVRWWPASRWRWPPSIVPALGPLRADISLAELRSAGLGAMDEVALRLGLGDAHVVFGHTHRAGPLPGDEEREWRGRGGARLVNAGSWTYASVFLAENPSESPYWPGSCVLVEDDGPPVVLRLLRDRSREQLARPRAAGRG